MLLSLCKLYVQRCPCFEHCDVIVKLASNGEKTLLQLPYQPVWQSYLFGTSMLKLEASDSTAGTGYPKWLNLVLLGEHVLQALVIGFDMIKVAEKSTRYLRIVKKQNRWTIGEQIRNTIDIGSHTSKWYLSTR